MTRKCGAALIFDEITAGWRLTGGGAHLIYGVMPDIAVYAKGMSNGYPMAAILGVAGVMEAAQTTFVSSTYWTERIGPAAALATIRKHLDLRVHEHLIAIGEAVQQGWQEAADRHDLHIHVGGIAPLGHFSFDYPNGQAVRTLFTQMMLERGILAAGACYTMYAHQPKHVKRYLGALDEVFALLHTAIERDEVEALLQGPVAHTGFRRLT